MDLTDKNTEVLVLEDKEKTFLAKGKFPSLFIGIFVAIVLFAAGYFFLSSKIPFTKTQSKNLSSSNSPSISPNQLSITTKQWVNCDDVRDVIEEDEKLYVTCLGGVLIVNKNSGKVIDQITTSQGLGNATATSLVKRGDELYIGTQDGFTIFNLKTKKAQKISVKEGLISGSNIELAMDEDTLWIGSFEGLSTYDMKTGKIQNFTAELADNSTKYNASQVLVTSKAVYAIVLANAYTPGGIARFDKQTRVWERFGPASFLEKLDQYSRVDFFGLEQVGEKIYVTDSRMLWEAEDKQGTSWKRLDLVVSEFKKDKQNIYFYIYDLGEGLGIFVDKILYSYNPDTQQIKPFYPQRLGGEFENVLTNADNRAVTRNGKMWFRPVNYNSSSNLPWLVWFRFNDQKSGSINLTNRPMQFSRVIAVIDNNPIIATLNGLVKYDNLKNTFEKIFPSKFISLEGNENGFVFQPIENTTKILIFSQGCGQGCSQPEFNLFNYADSSNKPLEISDELKQKINVGSGSFQNYAALIFLGFDSDKNGYVFDIGNKEIGVLNKDSFSWSFAPNQTTEEKPDLDVSRKYCNPNYEFKTNSGKFKNSFCTKEAVNDKYRWFYQQTDKGGELWQENKTTGERLKLGILVAEEEYSPFGWAPRVEINKFTYAYGKLWIGTNRGLSVYDPENKTWKLITVKEGLLSNKVTSFVISQNQIWAVTEWGGLSVISY